MQRLWAPWRMAYVTGERPEGCVLCDARKHPVESHVLYQSEHNFAILNRFPYNNGHTMVVPNEHLSDFLQLSQEQIADMMDLAQGVAEALQGCMRAEGINLGMNLGQAAGAGIDDHLHLHVVPRWQGDTNFLTTIAETRVVPQALEACYATMEPVLREIMQRRRAGS
jgi:ATP adenylyltransferase